VAVEVAETRLALELASLVAPQFVDGVTLVELAAITDRALIPLTITSALGIRE
jgi:predicted ATPase